MTEHPEPVDFSGPVDPQLAKFAEFIQAQRDQYGIQRDPLDMSAWIEEFQPQIPPPAGMDAAILRKIDVWPNPLLPVEVSAAEVGVEVYTTDAAAPAPPPWTMRMVQQLRDELAAENQPPEFEIRPPFPWELSAGGAEERRPRDPPVQREHAHPRGPRHPRVPRDPGPGGRSLADH
ncbi:hypothetical protein SEA_LILBEANIE_84 [Gordonia phage Lilbeanie]|uniref:Uncharacterized protein n=1 Tax=Gordonia phage Lilbeanie TaxID=2794947 RepID=A0A7T1NXR9_9CAUD|nr:hypothetical protein J1773_gp84 [Gordonia phage Lilbeanie]QPO17162.1 hypothetical protein SEA_LILBEANIE_84 [Gordonia phage Lilbeanie]